jgi:enamine deaminase RidA (YjgF/YER057c/UK114 family)
MTLRQIRRRCALGLLGLLAISITRAESPEDRLAQLGLSLPAPSTAVANYVPAVRAGSLIFLAGHLPRDPAGNVIRGKVGVDVSEAVAVEAARATALALIATLKAEVGDLQKIRRIVRVGGFVNAPDTYERHPVVLNGCSDLLVALFGERGRHARAAVGVSSLPLGAVIEIELVAEVVED